MNVIQKFQIKTNKSIAILVPDLKDKFNYYYEPTDKLHMFDEVSVVFKEKNKVVILSQDNLNIILFSLKNSLERAFSNQSVLSESINIGELGRFYNINMINENTVQFNYSPFWVWSIRGTQTWIYNRNNKIYLEISPSYPWLFVEPEENENIISFDEFMKTYNPIVLDEIDKNITKEWLNQCNAVINNMIKV